MTGDPRVYFAAERTLLAWVRTGLTVIALGFVVARFGLFLVLISAPGTPAAGMHPSHHWPSTVLGVALVLLGAAAVLGALRNHRAYIRTIPAEDRPEMPAPWLASLLALAISTTGFLLAIYLLVA
jgi:putative membrane protein